MTSNRKGIILAGGSGIGCTLRRWLQQAALTVYDKPMIYFPLTSLMLAGFLITLIPQRRGSLPVRVVAG